MLSLGMILLTVTLVLVSEKLILMVYGHLPGVDPSTTSGYIWTSVVHITFMTVGAFGLYAGDVSSITFMSQVGTFHDILKCKFRDLNDILSSEPDNRRKSCEALSDLLKFHQRYLR